jgi:hypothetical protein
MLPHLALRVANEAAKVQFPFRREPLPQVITPLLPTLSGLIVALVNLIALIRTEIDQSTAIVDFVVFGS